MKKLDGIPLSKSEIDYRSLIDSSTDIIFSIDEQGQYQFVNKIFSSIFDQEPEYFVGKTIWDIYDQEQADYRYAAVQKVFKTGKSVSIEVTVPLQEQKLYFQVNISPIRDQQQKIVLALAHSINITDKKQIEFALRESEERFQSIFQSSPSIIAISRLQDDIFIDVNKAFCQTSGYTRHETIGKSSTDLKLWLNPHDLAFVLESLNQGKKIEKKEISFRKKNGEIIIGLYSSSLINIAGETLVLSNILDITTRKKAELALSHSHDLMSYIIEHSKSAIAVHDRDLRYIYVSQRYLDDYKLKNQNIIGRYHYDVFPDLPQKWRDVHRKALNGEISSAEDDPFPREDGTMEWTRWECRPWYEADGSIGGIIIYTEVITDRKMLEVALANENSLLRTTLISVGDGVVSTDNQRRIVLFNRVAEKLTGWSYQEAKGRPIEDVFNILIEHSGKKRENIVNQVLSSGKPCEIENNTVLVARNGSARSIENSASPIITESGEIIGAVLVFRDSTEKKNKLAEIEYLSFHDHLTGVYNRRHFDYEMKKLNSNQANPITLIMADINGLKLTNDAFGHRAGDIIIEKVANIFKHECRAEDIISRVGGDEFAILLPKTDSEHADILIRRINQAIEKEKIENITLSVSIGYAVKKDRNDDLNDIYRQAEDEMYRRKLSDSSSMRSKTITLIMNTLYDKSSREMGHANRVSEICQSIAVELGFDKNDTDQIKIAGLMHDIGKIGIDEAILNCQGQLDQSEWLQVEKHPEIGFRILSSVNEFSVIANDVLSHHEKWDGSGYPRGIKGREISLHARIIALADAYDAMTSERKYRKILDEDAAVHELRKFAGIQFDPDITRVFIEKVLKKEWIN